MLCNDTKPPKFGQKKCTKCLGNISPGSLRAFSYYLSWASHGSQAVNQSAKGFEEYASKQSGSCVVFREPASEVTPADSVDGSHNSRTLKEMLLLQGMNIKVSCYLPMGGEAVVWSSLQSMICCSRWAKGCKWVSLCKVLRLCQLINMKEITYKGVFGKGMDIH